MNLIVAVHEPGFGTKRTSSDVRLESAVRGKADYMCSERVFRLLTQDRTSAQLHSFYHLVRADEQRGWHLDAQRLRSLEIYDQFEARWLVNW